MDADRITSEILRNKFDAVVSEMRATLVNTACSPTISEMKECCCALFTEDPFLAAIDNPRHLASMQYTAAAAVDKFQYDMGPEDIILTNDPYSGGTRIQDFTMVAPVAYEDEIVSYVCIRGQIEDFGGDLRGNLNPRATDIWAEGVRCTPVKYMRDGKVSRDLLNTISLNSRNPESLRLDLDAMLAAVNIGRLRLRQMIHEHGRRTIIDGMNWTIEYAEKRLSSLIAAWNDGEFHGESTVAHDCQSRSNLKIRARLAVANSRLTIDFSGTDAQTSSFVNATLGTAASLALLPIYSALDHSIPKNYGTLRCIDLICPTGSLVNADYPAPTGWSGHHCGAEIAAAVTDALSKLDPRAAAVTMANMPLAFALQRAVRHGDTLEQLGVKDVSRFAQGDCSGAFGRDGWGMPGASAEGPFPSVEMFESETGARLDHVEFTSDSCGAGQWRGGPGTEARLRLPQPAIGDYFLTACLTDIGAERKGINGGQPGAGNSIAVEIEGSMQDIKRVLLDSKVSAGAQVVVRMGGGAGWGNPLERSVDAVRDDVIKGYLSVMAAEKLYGVVFNAKSLEVDEAATATKRKKAFTH